MVRFKKSASTPRPWKICSLDSGNLLWVRPVAYRPIVPPVRRLSGTAQGVLARPRQQGRTTIPHSHKILPVAAREPPIEPSSLGVHLGRIGLQPRPAQPPVDHQGG